MAVPHSAHITPVLHDQAARDAVATDYGGYIHHVPVGTLRATSVDDVRVAVRYAQHHQIKLAVRGAGHSTHGQAQVAGGLVLDLRGLNRVLDLTDSAMWVEAGLTWRGVAHAALAVERTFPVFTDYLATTVGGTLAVGGVGSRTWQHGAQTDHVLELEVVTAHGTVVRCSPQRNAALFNAVRCGLGQIAIVTKARLRLVAAPRYAYVHRALYAAMDTFLHELQLLIDEGTYDCVQGFALGNDSQAIVGHIGPAAAAFPVSATAGAWVYCIEVVKFGDQPADPAMTMPRRRGWLPDGAWATELPYLEYIDRLGPVEEKLRHLGVWQLPHPMLDLILPGSQARAFLAETLAALEPAEVAGPVLIYPYERTHLRTPLFRAPDEPRVVLFGLMRTTVPPTPAHVQAQIDDNRRLYERALAYGGCFYPIDSVPMTPGDWQAHFGDQWATMAAAKQRWDPAHLLNPGHGMFGSWSQPISS